MSTTKKPQYAADENGIDRLVAAPGDETPGKDAPDPGPFSVTMAPQQWDDEAREFKAGPGEDA